MREVGCRRGFEVVETSHGRLGPWLVWKMVRLRGCYDKPLRETPWMASPPPYGEPLLSTS